MISLIFDYYEYETNYEVSNLWIWLKIQSNLLEVFVTLFGFKWWKRWKILKTCLLNLILFLPSNFGRLPLQLGFEGFGMALFLQSLKPSAIPTLFLSKTRISTIITSKTSSVSVSVSPSSRYPSLKRSCSTTNSSYSMESDASSTGVFIKGTYTRL